MVSKKEKRKKKTLRRREIRLTGLYVSLVPNLPPSPRPFCFVGDEEREGREGRDRLWKPDRIAIGMFRSQRAGGPTSDDKEADRINMGSKSCRLPGGRDRSDRGGEGT